MGARVRGLAGRAGEHLDVAGGLVVEGGGHGGGSDEGEEGEGGLEAHLDGFVGG